MRRVRLSLAGRAGVLSCCILPLVALAVWRWFAHDYTMGTLAAIDVCLLLDLAASAEQHRCRQRRAWYLHMAQHDREAAAGLRRKAELNAACAVAASGVRPRAYYLRRAKHLLREAEQREAAAAQHARAACW